MHLAETLLDLIVMRQLSNQVQGLLSEELQRCDVLTNNTRSRHGEARLSVSGVLWVLLKLSLLLLLLLLL
jgi:hypothetical protein